MSLETNNEQQYVEPINPVPQYPMKWYNFLIYFLLFASAVLNAISAIPFLTGSIYEGNAKLVYAFYDGLKAIDMITGLACLAIAAFAIYTRTRLAGYKKNGPNCVYILYAAGAAINLLYSLAAMFVIGIETLPSSVIGSIIGSGIMVVANYVYFQKRKDLFVND